MPESKRFNIIKVDVDLKPPAEWMQKWSETREIIINSCGLELKKVRYHPTDKGWHFWFHIDPAVGYEEMICLQFLLGDDHPRAYFSLQRQGFKRFRHLFNILFSKKMKVDDVSV